jgi:hypothetical protein
MVCPSRKPVSKSVPDKRADGTLFVDYLTWDGIPDTTFAARGKASLQAWVNGAHSLESGSGGEFHLKQNEGRGLAIQGTREWVDYRASATLSAHLAKSFGLAARVQGMQRFYALLLCSDGIARLVKALDGDRVLAEAPFAWQLDIDYEFGLHVRGNHVHGSIDGQELFKVQDVERPLDGGGIALVCEEGNIKARSVRVQPF